MVDCIAFYSPLAAFLSCLLSLFQIVPKLLIIPFLCLKDYTVNHRISALGTFFKFRPSRHYGSPSTVHLPPKKALQKNATSYTSCFLKLRFRKPLVDSAINKLSQEPDKEIHTVPSADQIKKYTPCLQQTHVFKNTYIPK